MSAQVPAGGHRPARTHYHRFGRTERLLHGFLMFSFLGLAFTGLPLLFSHQPWAATLARIFGGFASAGVIHRLCAVVMISVFTIHLSGLSAGCSARRTSASCGARTRWSPAAGLLRDGGPHPLVRRPWAAAALRSLHLLGEVRLLGRLLGMGIIGGSGLVLWFPELFAYVLPGWMFNIATVVHGEEALLAVGFIFTIHFFNGHLRPEKFPMDSVIFTGRVTVQEMEEERPEEFERLRRAGRLDELASAAAPRWSTVLGAPRAAPRWCWAS